MEFYEIQVCVESLEREDQSPEGTPFLIETDLVSILY